MAKNICRSWGPVLAYIACGAIVGMFVEATIDEYIYTVLVYAAINVILATSLNLVLGITGQFSMGHGGFMAVGAYTGAFLSLKLAPVIPEGVIFQGSCFGAILYLSGVAAAALGYIVGLPTLRLRGDYLAIVTLGFGEIVRVMILNLDAVGGARGLPGIPQWTHLSWVIVVAVLCTETIRRLLASNYGRAMLAVREDETAAEAMGVNTTQTKVSAFVISAFFAGVAGGLFGHYLTYLNPQTFDFNKSFEFIIMVVLGGMGSTSGAVFAALFLTIVKEALRPLQVLTGVDLRMSLFSLMLIFLMILRPNGFFGSKELQHTQIWMMASKWITRWFHRVTGRGVNDP
jgi:branched-chain amino acid transport system permease protein